MINNMADVQPGPEMDKAVAMKMGWQIYPRDEFPEYYDLAFDPDNVLVAGEIKGGGVQWIPSFSTDHNAVFGPEGPVEWMRKNKAWYLVITDSKPPRYGEKETRFKCLIFNRGGSWLATGKSEKLPHAVCKAFLGATV